MLKLPALWLPEYYVPTTPADDQRRDSLAFVILQLGYKDIFGQVATWDGVRARLDRYSLRTLLDINSKVSAYLNTLPRQDLLAAAQQRICSSIFGARAAEVWARALQARHHEAGATVLFGDLQLINLVKVALLVMPSGDRESDSDLTALGEAALMVSELMWDLLHPAVPAGEGGTLPAEWQQMILANGLFHAGGRWRDDLVRSHELYLTDKPNLRACPVYVNLPERIRAIVGMEPQALWSVLIAFCSHWAAFDESALHRRQGGFNSRTYFARNYSFSPDEVRSFLNLCSSDVGVLQNEVNERYTLEKLDPLDFLPLAKAPLIELGDMVYLTSAKLLAEKLTRGIYHLFLDARRTPAAADRKQFLDFMGPAFEDYVARWLERVYPAGSGRFLGESVLRARLGPQKCCDGILLFPEVESAVLVECKATLFPHEVRTSRNREQFERVIQDVFLDAGAQLSATIDAIEAGALQEDGVRAGSIHSYLPVVVTPDEVAASPPVHQRVLNELSRRGLLGQREARPLQALTMAELEALEADLVAGESLQRLLAEKVSLDEWMGQPLRNYCMARRPDLAQRKNERILALTNALFEQARAYFAAHDRGEPERP